VAAPVIPIILLDKEVRVGTSLSKVRTGTTQVRLLFGPIIYLSVSLNLDILQFWRESEAITVPVVL
jgi:hypothetical protein